MPDRKKLIDANALVEDLEAAKANNGMGALVASTLIRYVKRCTTVDAVEVVRCKDCEYSGHFDGLLYCENSRGLAGIVSPEGFCSYGERRTNEPEKPV